MRLLALEPAPATDSDWAGRVKALRLEQHGIATELMSLLSDDGVIVEADRARELLVRTTEVGSELLSLVLTDVRFWQWAAAGWYYKATGCHAETGCCDDKEGVKVDGNVYDIREVLARRRR